MEKKPQNRTGNRNGNPVSQESKWPDETIIRYIIRALLLEQGVPKGACKADPPCMPDGK